MNKYFDVCLEFDHSKLIETIERSIREKSKGYMCVVDINILATAQKDQEFRKIVNSAVVNTCDGSSVAILAGWVHKSKFLPFNGPELFSMYIEKPYKHLLLGNTTEVKDKIIASLSGKNISIDDVMTMELPFCKIDQFDFPGIAKEIGKLDPDIIWVSLGAPKQEAFMSRLVPYLNSGFLIGIGAAFSFYTGDLSIPKIKIGNLKLIWLSRIFADPSKSIKRIYKALLVLPGMIIRERRLVKHH
jgi:N-acetylglucosaminyldiphosphoundecaprenol N-acetyl-beta-D-mannosaminyltransferase